MLFKNLLQGVSPFSSPVSRSMTTNNSDISQYSDGENTPMSVSRPSPIPSPSLGLREVNVLTDSGSWSEGDEEESGRRMLRTLRGGFPLQIGSILLNPTAGVISEESGDSQYDAVINSIPQLTTVVTQELESELPVPSTSRRN